jgi:hypothetical protein
VLSGVLGAGSAVADGVSGASINAMLFFFVCIALSSLMKWRIGAFVFGTAVGLVFYSDPRGSSLVVAIAFSVLVGVAVTLMFRYFGLFTSVVAMFVGSALIGVPLTTEVGAWHARGMIVVLAAIGALLAWGFVSATGVGRGRAVSQTWGAVSSSA